MKKFTDRKAAVARIWAAIQRLTLKVAPQASDVAPAKETMEKPSSKAPRRAPAPKSAKDAKRGAEERSNKKAEVVAMMKRANGATLTEIMEATGWQAHTVRGFVSILGGKGGEKVESSKNAKGARMYRISK